MKKGLQRGEIRLNKVILIGRLTKDPELTFGKANGTAICSFSIAVSRRFKKDGQPEADFINCTAFGKTGENLANYKQKGDLIGVEGQLQIDTYEKDGVKKYSTKVICNEVQFCDNKTKGQSQTSSAPGGMSEYVDDGECPF